MTTIKVAVNGYGVIGKRVADAVNQQEDMQLVGVADVAADWRLWPAVEKGIAVYGPEPEQVAAMEQAGLQPAGLLDDLLDQVEVVVDCTPKHIAAANVNRYRSRGVKFIVQGGEKHAVTGHSFVAESSYAGAVGRDATRVVSCNTTSIVRTLGALKSAGLLQRARGTLLRRATDPWESERGGIMNTIIPEPTIPSHQGPDAQSVDPDLDVVTMAAKVPTTTAHLHYWTVQLTHPTAKEEVVGAFRAASRIALINTTDGLTATNVVKELMGDLGRPRDSMYEVAVWEDMLKVQGDELFYAYMVDNQAIVIPDNIDAIRALTGMPGANESITRTNTSLGIGTGFR